MKGLYLVTFLSLALVLCCYGDVYMHNPRGSNNRLNENSANRRNANRAFDSQNNDRGGYNKGDKTKDPANNDRNKQYHMKYFQSAPNVASKLKIEWTNQHGLGVENKKLISNMVIQAMCQESSIQGKEFEMRDGVQSNTQGFNGGSPNDNKLRFESRRRQTNMNFVLQEPFENYERCNRRQRNKGLFTADQKLNGEQATKTRQNPNGQRRGYECPEERDYYPYWHPTYFIDIAVLTSDISRCQYYQSESFNVKPRHECVEENKQTSRHNNQQACEAAGGTWTEFHNYLEILHYDENKCKEDINAYKKKGVNVEWANVYDHDNRKKACIVLLDEPECLEVDFTRVNHLGNAKDLLMMNYDWKIPHFPSERDHRCVLRLRYNITTGDYDPWNTGSESNKANLENQDPPKPQLIENDPAVDIGIENTPLQLAINTAQTGRTFQDRSHVFLLRSRKDLPDNVKNKVINNWNVRGKRGNIVQTYPANEYDFTPVNLEMRKNEVFHVQWTGSNTHNNGNPGGDGQTGDAGEGKAGTDRHNMLPLKDLNYNFPMAMESSKGNLFKRCTALWLSQGDVSKLDKDDVAIQFASSGYFHCENNVNCPGQSLQQKSGFDSKLDNAPASFEGAIFQCPPGTYHVVCTRNNNFSNRSQKGTLLVK